MRPEYVRRWLADPKSVLPYTAMPAHFPATGEPLGQDLFPGSSREQLDAVTELLIRYDEYVTPASEDNQLTTANVKCKITDLKSQISDFTLQCRTALTICTRRRFLARTAAGLAGGRLSAPAIVRAEAANWGDLTGRFVYDGKPPERKKLKVDKDLECCGKFDIRDESLMVGPDGGLANVYVYLRSTKAPDLPGTRSGRRQAGRAGQPRLHLPAALHEDLVHEAGVFDRQFRSRWPRTWLSRRWATCRPTSCCRSAARPRTSSAAGRAAPCRSPAIIIRGSGRTCCRATIPTWPFPPPTARSRIAKLPVGQWQFQAWHETDRAFQPPQWPKGRFRFTIRPGSQRPGHDQDRAGSC